MSVNSMNIEDVRALLNEIHTQATGNKAIAPISTSDFVSMATSTLSAGTDTVYNALMQTIGQTVFAVRPYERRFGGLVTSNERFGAIRRKISFCDKNIQEDSPVWNPTDGQTVDQWKINKSDVLEMRYYGSDVYQDYVTIFRDQLVKAFDNEAQLGSFVSNQMLHMSNKWEQYLENLNRTALLNFIAAKYEKESGVIHLLTEYKTLTGLDSLTAEDIYQDTNLRPFFTWVRARINTLSRQMSERSSLFQVAVSGKTINRHTPVADQRLYLTADALDIIDTMVNPTVYHDDPLVYADVEAVSYWQNINDPDKAQITPVLMNADGTVEEGTEQTVDKIFGVMFDRDAIATNIYSYSIDNTLMNVRGKYYNTFVNADIQLTNDLTEKGIVLLLD